MNHVRLISYKERLDDLNFRNSDNESPTPSPVLGLLIHDFVGKVPGEKQNIVWLVFQDPLRRHYGYMSPRCKPALLQWAAISNVTYSITADIQKGQ